MWNPGKLIKITFQLHLGFHELYTKLLSKINLGALSEFEKLGNFFSLNLVALKLKNKERRQKVNK